MPKASPKKRATSTHRPPKKVRKALRKPQAAAKTWQELFISELRKCGNVRAACAKARIERSTAYKARKGDSAFADQWKDALDDAIDDLEAEAWRRAAVGNKRIILYKGEPVLINGKPLIEYEQSDTLHVLLLKAHRPDKYRERNDAINVNLDFTNLTNEQVERLARGEDVRAVLASPGASGTGDPETPEPASGDRVVDAATPE